MKRKKKKATSDAKKHSIILSTMKKINSIAAETNQC